MDAIAQAAGVSKQTVYSHFKSKDELFRACVASKVQMYGLDESKLDVDAPVDEALRRVGKQFLTLLSDPEVIQMFRLMIAEANSFPRVARSFHETGPRATVDYVTQIFSNYLPDNASAKDAENAACEFIALIKSEYFMERLLGIRGNLTGEDVANHVEHCVKQIKKLYPVQRSAL